MEIFKSKIYAEAESTEVLNKKLHNLHTSTETVVVFPTKKKMHARNMQNARGMHNTVLFAKTKRKKSVARHRCR
jgi:hypothetical protein